MQQELEGSSFVICVSTFDLRVMPPVPSTPPAVQGPDFDRSSPQRSEKKVRGVLRTGLKNKQMVGVASSSVTDKDKKLAEGPAAAASNMDSQEVIAPTSPQEMAASFDEGTVGVDYEKARRKEWQDLSQRLMRDGLEPMSYSKYPGCSGCAGMCGHV